LDYLKPSLCPRKSLEILSSNKKKKRCQETLGDFKQLARLKTTLKSNAYTSPDKCQLESDPYWSHTRWKAGGVGHLQTPRQGKQQELAAQAVLQEDKCLSLAKSANLSPHFA
jgi:hypothetical protein